MRNKISILLFLILSVVHGSYSYAQAPIGGDSTTTKIKGVAQIGKGFSFVKLNPTQAFKNYFQKDTTYFVFVDSTSGKLCFMRYGIVDTIGNGGSAILPFTYIGVGDPSNALTGYSDFTYDPLSKTFAVQFGGNLTLEAGITSGFVYGVIGDYSGLNNNTYISAFDQYSRVLINGNKVTPQSTPNGTPFDATVLPPPQDGFFGSGLNDMQLFGSFTGVARTTYTVAIDGAGSPNTISWTDGIVTMTHVAIAGGVQDLNNGVQIVFGASAGHTLNNSWTWTVNQVQYGQMAEFNGLQNRISLGDLDVLSNNGTFNLNFNKPFVEASISDVNSTYFITDPNSKMYGIGDGVNGTGPTGNNTSCTIDDAHKTNILTNAISYPGMQSFTTTATRDSLFTGFRGAYINPPSLISTDTIVFPLNAADGQEEILYFGGTITSGTVVQLATIKANTGDAIVGPTSLNTPQAGENIVYKYELATHLWRGKLNSGASNAVIKVASGVLFAHATSATIVTYPVNTTGDYTIAGHMATTNTTSGQLTYTATWTDNNSVVQSVTLGQITASTHVTDPLFSQTIYAKTGTNIVLTTTVVGGTLTNYDVSYVITE